MIVRDWLRARPWIWLVVFMVVVVIANVALWVIAASDPPQRV